MLLKKIKVQNFKRVANVDIDVADVNILVGANGCGKSSIIQAVHLACCVLRQADRVGVSKTSTVGIDELDYLPTDDYKTLGHRNKWGNKEGTPSSQILLGFERNDSVIVSADCTMRSARNAGISVSGTVPIDLSSSLRSKKRFFSAYIPGISGIPNKEERKSRKVILKACSFGDSNVILRNALLLLKESAQDNIKLIEMWLGKIIGPIVINVSHNNDNDLYITCDLTIDGTTRPIELAGTGYLQLIQIFCYVLLFEPGLLLIDEPDIHLHPHVQEKLVVVLSEVAKERGIRMLLTTHSPFIVRGAPQGTNVCWLQDGTVESQNRQLVEVALGWGAFGKKLIIVSEDSNNSLLRKLISQWPSIDRSVAFYPGSGYKSLPSPPQAKELSETLGKKFKILIHRDRDSLTDNECAAIIKKYEAAGVHCWFTEQSDIEAYFVTPNFLQNFLECTSEEAKDHISQLIVKNAVTISDIFRKQRAVHNAELHSTGGGPENESVWNSFSTRELKGACGKFIFKQMKNKIPQNIFNENKILSTNLNASHAFDLKMKLEELLT